MASSTLTNYDAFFEQLDYNIEEMKSEARSKLDAERFNLAAVVDLPGNIPFFGNPNNLGDSDAADISKGLERRWSSTPAITLVTATRRSRKWKPHSGSPTPC